MEFLSPIVYVILFIVAIPAFAPVIVSGFLYPFWKYLFWPLLQLKRPTYSPKKHFFPLFKVLALIIDQWANAFAGALLNDLMLKKNKKHHYHVKAYKYGKPYDTISEVTGINEERNTLNPRGKWFTKMLGYFIPTITFTKVEGEHKFFVKGKRDKKPMWTITMGRQQIEVWFSHSIQAINRDRNYPPHIQQ
jgi:hypothetical protein